MSNPVGPITGQGTAVAPQLASSHDSNFSNNSFSQYPQQQSQQSQLLAGANRSVNGPPTNALDAHQIAFKLQQLLDLNNQVIIQ